ncbi:26325_t:CDS:1 [Racocetra persica]|uniref:26325_t:CDS:1 n=1 Tax=Racocetra persica TaxID=160502 RepID=A0ACA9RWT1_9GLOM|nr:26325_t:CDS:1 [Racocetra persica]
MKIFAMFLNSRKHIKKVHDKKTILEDNNDINKIFDMCDKILKDPKYDNNIISEPLTEKQERFMVHLEFQLSEQIGKIGAYAISFESSKKPFLNMKAEEMEGLEYPVVRILAAEGFPNIEMTTSDTLNRTYFRDFLKAYYDIDYDNTEGISYNQLKTIILATKIE